MSGDKAKILLVEDNVALSGVICFNLTRAGYQVTAVGNGREAIEALQRGRFDLVLSDQQMPKMTGIQLCEHIREMPDHAHTPFILLTAKCMEIDVAKLAAAAEYVGGAAQAIQPERIVDLYRRVAGQRTCG